MRAGSIARSIVLVFVVAVFLIARTNASAQRQGPQPVANPAQGDGGVSAFYTWVGQIPATPGRLLRQEPLPETCCWRRPQRECAFSIRRRTALAEGRRS